MYLCRVPNSTKFETFLVPRIMVKLYETILIVSFPEVFMLYKSELILKTQTLKKQRRRQFWLSPSHLSWDDN